MRVWSKILFIVLFSSACESAPGTEGDGLTPFPDDVCCLAMPIETLTLKNIEFKDRSVAISVNINGHEAVSCDDHQLFTSVEGQVVFTSDLTDSFPVQFADLGVVPTEGIDSDVRITDCESEELIFEGVREVLLNVNSYCCSQVPIAELTI